MKNISLILLLLLLSCTSNRSDLSLVVPEGQKFLPHELYGAKIYKNIKGEDSSPILLFIPLGRPSFSDAVNNTVKNADGNFLINAKVDEITKWYILFGIHKIEITADVIQLPVNK